ncbi:MAG: hypothetical protein PHQ23_12890, partial [Candidatus Wallbacteria bacterium]|nr:hypothetical protein [Candidatus Wallbacteria bacterium]
SSVEFQPDERFAMIYNRPFLILSLILSISFCCAAAGCNDTRAIPFQSIYDFQISTGEFLKVEHMRASERDRAIISNLLSAIDKTGITSLESSCNKLYFYDVQGLIDDGYTTQNDEFTGSLLAYCDKINPAIFGRAVEGLHTTSAGIVFQGNILLSYKVNLMSDSGTVISKSVNNFTIEPSLTQSGTKAAFIGFVPAVQVVIFERTAPDTILESLEIRIKTICVTEEEALEIAEDEAAHLGRTMAENYARNKDIEADSVGFRTEAKAIGTGN